MNRKTWLRLKLILLILVFLVLCLFTGRFLVRMSAPSGWTLFGSWHPRSPVQASRSSQAPAQVFDGVDKIIVQSTSLPVNIYESDVEKVTVRDNSRTFGLRLKSANTVTEEDGILSIRQGRQISLVSITTGNFEVEVPRGTVLEYEVKNVSGSVYHDAPSKKELKVTSVSGSIRILQGGETANIKSTSGSVRIYEPFKELTAKSTSGSVRATADGTSGQMYCSTTSGSVKIRLWQAPGYELTYSTVSGSVKDTYSDTSYSRSGSSRFGDGSIKIDASSVSGSVKLTDWD